MGETDVFYRAMMARDSRFDGKFFVGVKTTGIFCRPVCPAKPKRENVEFFSSRFLAENAGYRPCLRCRPECAPMSPAWCGKSAVIQRALKKLMTDQVEELGEDSFAEQFGITARHLRRLFEQEIGQTPKQIYQNNRLNFARKLIVETRLPITTVSETAGFGSLRRFNDAFKKRFSKPPSELRKNASSANVPDGIELDLPFRPPYQWESCLHFFESHRILGVEQIDDNSYQRVFKLETEVGWLRVTWGDTGLKLNILCENPRRLFEIVSRVRRMFDLDSDPLIIKQHFAQNKLLSNLYKKFPGLRLPRGWDPFETAIGTLLGQLVSVDRAKALIGQVVEHYGEEISHPLTGNKIKIFPAASVLADADLSHVKTTTARKNTIRELSKKVANGEINLSDAQDPSQFREQLLAIKGIGPWSAEYISLRAVGDTDAFPGTDLILRRVIALHPELNIEGLKPWRSYGAIYLWKEFAKSLSQRKDKKI